MVKNRTKIIKIRRFKQRIFHFSTALIELPTRVSENTSIKSIQLPSTCSLNAGNQTVISAGNGLSEVHGTPFDKRLRHAVFTTMSRERCKKQLSASNKQSSRFIESNSIICAKSSKGRAIYTGDSGL